MQNSVDVSSVWLKTDGSKIGRLFREFLARHGHRGVKEYDLSTETWGLDSRPIVSVLQSMVANPSTLSPTSAETQAEDDWMKEMQLTKPAKYALKFIVPRARNAIVNREKTKAMLIRTIHCFRLAYRHLAKLMVYDGKIPDAGLIFFFTHSELLELITTPKGGPLIAKAVRRRKLYPEMDALVFPEMSLCIPKPVQDSSHVEELDVGADGVQLKGTPVFKGTIRGIVRVALNLDEARQIQCGEILITRCTDIGWSPYFPLLAGVVMEQGGLISHGAVVTREYVSDVNSAVIPSV